MLPKFLRPEVFPYASVEIIPAPVAPERHRDLTPAMDQQLCVCGVRFPRHFDGWDGNRLDCTEARRRAGLPVAVDTVEQTIENAERTRFHALMTDERTSGLLTAMIAENAATDAALAADGAHDGPACGPNCFHPYRTDPTARVVDVDDRDEDRGSTCGANCGYCGRCS